MEHNNQSLSPMMQNPDKEIFKQFNENQAKELEIKLIEAQIAKDNSERQFIFATKQLEAQERNLKDFRQYTLQYTKVGNLTAIFAIFIVCSLFGFCIYMNLNRDQVVLELVKIICYGASFGLGGFYWGRNKAQAENKNNHDSKES